MIFKNGFTLKDFHKSIYIFSKDVKVYYEGKLVYFGKAGIGWGDFDNKRLQRKFEILMQKHGNKQVHECEQTDDYTYEITLID